jgi:ribosome maturation factor RimP
MATLDHIRSIVVPVIADRGFELYDVEQQGPTLRVTVTAAGGGQAPSIDDLSAITREVSHRLDEDDPIAGRYTLEVSSPGLERVLRLPEHFAGAVGETVSVKVRRAAEGGARRLRGVVRAATERDVVVELAGDDAGDDAPAGTEATIAYDDIEKARTVFEWGPTSKPGGRSAAPPPRTRRSTP